jgi:hypothetical protein
VHFGIKLYNDQRNAKVFNLSIYFRLSHASYSSVSTSPQLEWTCTLWSPAIRSNAGMANRQRDVAFDMNFGLAWWRVERVIYGHVRCLHSFIITISWHLYRRKWVSKNTTQCITLHVEETMVWVKIVHFATVSGCSVRSQMCGLFVCTQWNVITDIYEVLLLLLLLVVVFSH